MTTSFSHDDQELQVIERTVETWNSHDVEGFLDCLADEVYWDDPAMPRPAENKVDVRRWCETLMRAIPDFTFKICQPYRGTDHRYAVHWEATGTLTGCFDPPGFAPTNRHFRTHGVDLIEFHDGRISRIVTNFDGFRAGEQMGLLPPRPRPGSAAEWMTVRAQRMVAWFQRRGASSARTVGLP